MPVSQNIYIQDASVFRRALVYQLFMFCVIALSLFASPGHCELKALSEEELKASTAQAGFTNFTLSNNTARLFLDIHIETYATITGLSAGYYDDGTNGLGWDIQWNNVTLGTSSNDPLVIDGLVFMADFDDLSSSDPTLERIVIGSNRLQGTLSADMASYSGMYNDALTSGGGSPVSALDRAALGATTFNFNSNGSQTSDMGLFFVLDLTGSTANFQVIAGYDESTLSTLTDGPWWDSP
jgi:hypothetical protein